MRTYTHTTNMQAHTEDEVPHHTIQQTTQNTTPPTTNTTHIHPQTHKHACTEVEEVECIWNMMAHVQKPDFVFRQNGWVNLNQRGRQFSRLLAAEVYTSALVMLDTPHSEVAWDYWLPTPFASFPFTSPPVHHRVPSGFKRTLPHHNTHHTTHHTIPCKTPHHTAWAHPSTFLSFVSHFLFWNSSLLLLVQVEFFFL